MYKKGLFILILLLCQLSFAYASDNYFEVQTNEIRLEDYFNDANIQNYKVRENEYFRPSKASDILPADKNFQEGDFSIKSSSEKTNDKYLLEGIEQKTGLNLNKKYFELETGFYNVHTRADINHSTKEVYLAPKLKYKDKVSLEATSYMDSKGDYFRQEVGLKYMPKFLKSGSVGITGGSKFTKDMIRSDRVKFTTDFFLF